LLFLSLERDCQHNFLLDLIVSMKLVYQLFFLFFALVGFSSFWYGSSLVVSPNSWQLACSQDKTVTISLSSLEAVYSADIKVFLTNFSLVSVVWFSGFDTVSYVGTWVATKAPHIGKTYHYITAYQWPFSQSISWSSLPVVSLVLRPIAWNTASSLVIYHLWVNGEDSNVAVWVQYDVQGKPIQYSDSLSSVSNWFYTVSACSVPWWWSLWGWGWSIIVDYCPNGDKSWNPYDGKCLDYTTVIPHGAPEGEAPKTCGVVRSPYSEELNNAFQFAYRFWITTICPIQKANVEWVLLRNHFAKMITEFAIDIVGKTPNPNIKWCDAFDDIWRQTLEMKNYIKQACQLWLMGFESDWVQVSTSFNPTFVVTRAQFWTVLSRLLFGSRYNIKSWEDFVWYKKHLSALRANRIMNNIDSPFDNEMRWWAMLMFMRVYESWILSKNIL
jgi:hypothetical protein